MSNQDLADMGRSIISLVDENETLKKRVQLLQLRLVLLFFGARFFSSPEMLKNARAAASKGYVYTDMILGTDGSVFVGHRDDVKQATSLEHFEALCLELAAPAEKEGAA